LLLTFCSQLHKLTCSRSPTPHNNGSCAFPPSQTLKNNVNKTLVIRPRIQGLLWNVNSRMALLHYRPCFLDIVHLLLFNHCYCAHIFEGLQMSHEAEPYDRKQWPWEQHIVRTVTKQKNINTDTLQNSPLLVYCSTCMKYKHMQTCTAYCLSIVARPSNTT
jgi:hypothetical protein